MDISLLLGLLIGLGGLGMGMILEGANLAGFIGVSPAVIVFGGTLGLALKSDSPDTDELVTRMVGLAEQARREGLLSLERNSPTKWTTPSSRRG